jgi:oligopeptide transport system substrate-binding protein
MKARFLSLLLLAAVFVGCSNKENQPTASAKQVFRMNLHSEPTSLDPRFVRDLPTLTTAKMLFDGLMRPNLKGELIPAAAARYTVSQDKKCYTFFLRDSLWSNGMPVTAYDFEYAWKSILSPDFPAEYAHQLFVIKNAEMAKKGLTPLSEVGIRAENARKLIVTLEHPSPYFLELTSFPITFPVCHEVAKKNPNWFTAQGGEFVCNGPFRLVKWNHGSELSAEKNWLYWDREGVKLDSIVLTMIEDEHTELNMYENNELDWAGSPNSSIPPEALPSLKENNLSQNELFVTPIAGTFCYKFNTRIAPFNSLKMRKAFSYAIDRGALVNNVLQANQIVAKTLLPPCMRENYPDVDQLAEIEHQKALVLFEEALAENNWTRETLPPITLIFSKSEKHQKIAQAIQQEWNNAFNIKVSLQSYEWNTFLEHLSKGNFQVGGRGWISDLSDPKTLLEIYKFANDPNGGGNNDTGWEHQQFISLIEEAEKTTEARKRYSMLVEAEKILLNEMPIAPLYHSTACYLKKIWVKDVYMSKLCDLDLKNAYIER